MPHISVTAAATPDKPAIIMGNTGVSVSYRELDERSNRAAQLFRNLGLVRGDHIGMMMENDRQFLEIAQGALRSGIFANGPKFEYHKEPEKTAKSHSKRGR